MSLGKRLAFLRRNRKLTQSELASRTFISRSRLALYETDRREPDLQTLKQLANFYDVTTDYLLENERMVRSEDAAGKAFEFYAKLQAIPRKKRKAIAILLDMELQCPF